MVEAAVGTAAAAAANAAVTVFFKLTGPRPVPPPELLIILDGIVVPTVEAICFSSSRIVIIWSVNTM